MGKRIELPMEEVSAIYISGVGAYDLAKQYKVDVTTVLKRLKEYGVEIRTATVAAALKNRDRGIKHNYFEDIKTQNPAYFTGFIAADGCVFKSKRIKQQAQLGIELHKQDLHILEDLNKELLSTKKISIREEKYVMLRVSSDKIVEDLKTYNIVERKSKILKFPDKMSKNMLRHFVRGFFDGDGCVSSNGKTCISIGFTTGSKEFLESLKKYLQEYSITTNSVISNVSCPTCYVLKYNTKESIRNLYKLFYEDAELFLVRKKVKFDKLIEEKYNNKTVKYKTL